MRVLLSLIAVLCLAAAPAARAQSAPVVVELFTSQGCSSCPPADRLLQDLAQREDVIALALHVDYWDYLGWPDPFGSPAHSRRQKDYARAAGRKMVYTPQMIVAGTDDVIGAHAREVRAAIAAHAARPPAVELTVTPVAAGARVRLTPLAGPLAAPAELHLVRYTARETADIARGENAGRSITYVNIVDGWTALGHWDGRMPVEIEAAIDGPRPAVLLVQEPGPGAILAAARLR